MPTSTGTIDFEPQLPFLLLGSIMNKAIGKPIQEGLTLTLHKSVYRFVKGKSKIVAFMGMMLVGVVIPRNGDA